MKDLLITVSPNSKRKDKKSSGLPMGVSEFVTLLLLSSKDEP